jgi:DMSO/TMAO reductase YedYZ molybdopterin-dependent catalytic subunit
VDRAKLDPHKFYRRLPLEPHQMRDRLTRVEDAIVLCHLGVPRIAREDWSLTIDGLVASPRTLKFADLARFAKVELTSFHQCAGSPFKATEPTRRVCNATWGGVRLAEILAACGPRPQATHVWSTGADYGEFGGVSVDCYVKDLPLVRVASDVLIAYEMNGAPLKAEHGFPARLLVPGFYGTNSVKWLTRLTIAPARASGPFTTRWYNDPVPDVSGSDSGRTAPVWSIPPQSLIVAPAPDASVACSRESEIWGWAWADGGVRTVEVAVGGTDWRPATLEPPTGWAWQRFSLLWEPRQRGAATLACRATSMSGEMQPPAERRNAIHGFQVTVD